jgi:DNA-directed RNA polymerase specialized sigma24 family protein
MFNEILSKFLLNQKISSDEEKLLIKEIKIIVYFAVKSIGKQLLYQIYEKDFMCNEILNETFIKLMEKKELIIYQAASGSAIKSYIKFIVKNSLIDKLRKKKLNLKCLNDETTGSKTESKKELLSYFESIDFIDIAQNTLTYNEKEALCYELISKIPPNKSKNAFNKTKSRAKSRLRNLVKENDFPVDVIEFSIKKLFMSKICKDFVSNIRS